MAEHQCDLLQSWAPLPARQHKTSKPGPTYATLGIHVVGLYRVHGIATLSNIFRHLRYLRPRESIITIGSILGDCMGLGSTWPNSESVVLFAVERLKENPAKPGRKGKQNVDHAEELLT
ncbi:hypothetical protein MCOR03_003951 [Pyricularia oryzae]|uniref:Uncharacterized protein n=1 Tax=Pyricularia grisea TaxID=148305 RepID=A0ABQ8NRN4_PYRGI|nr:hypothetical protein MCOR26_005540 [Pyricularia oryzae]KAI6301161.1 hypothetical protein MCOR33_003336 [Pyricularia grisea]KAI6341730.1 hypothetical protein MCOR28_005843 [Pyricularia oryzae]KAI6384725.1 hypothetical protein MCOR32_001994 [Pyricularia oryzae]KAI6390363.1 hypothetical protein MCOR23_009600 [Pyricularia oryzae]